MYIHYYILLILSLAFKLCATVSSRRILRHTLDVLSTGCMLIFCVASELRIGYLLATALFAFQIQFLFLVISKPFHAWEIFTKEFWKGVLFPNSASVKNLK